MTIALTYLVTAGTLLAAGKVVVEQQKGRELSKQNWDTVIAKLEPTATSEITVIALEYLNPGQLSVNSNPNKRLSSLGGVKGVRRMRANGDLLIALAAQAERSHPEATRALVSEMRHDGKELRRTALWLSLHLLDDRNERGQVCIQRAAASYYRMIYRLLEAAREVSPKHLASLSKALWN